jgi:hypothetical protein
LTISSWGRNVANYRDCWGYKDDSGSSRQGGVREVASSAHLRDENKQLPKQNLAQPLPELRRL